MRAHTRMLSLWGGTRSARGSSSAIISTDTIPCHTAEVARTMSHQHYTCQQEPKILCQVSCFARFFLMIALAHSAQSTNHASWMGGLQLYTCRLSAACLSGMEHRNSKATVNCRRASFVRLSSTSLISPRCRSSSRGVPGLIASLTDPFRRSRNHASTSPLALMPRCISHPSQHRF